MVQNVQNTSALVNTSAEDTNIDEFVSLRKGFESDWKVEIADLKAVEWLDGKPTTGDDVLCGKSICRIKANGQEFNLTELATKQMCDKLTSGLWSLFSKSPTTLQKDMMQTWLPMVNPRQQTVALKYNKQNNNILAVLDPARTDIPSSELFLAFAGALDNDGTAKFSVRSHKSGFFGKWVLPDYPINFRNGDEHLLMAYLKCSDFGTSDIQMDLGVFRVMCSNGTVARMATLAGEKPYLSLKYSGLQAEDLSAAFKSAAERCADYAKIFEDQLRLKASQPLTETDLKNLVENLPRFREGSKSVLQKLASEVAALKPTNIVSAMEILTEMVQKEDDLDRQYSHEVFAGRMLDLVLPLPIEKKAA